MKELSKTQLWIIGGMLAFGTTMIVTNLVAVIFISIGYTSVAMAVVLLMLEGGPCVWHWWIPFRMGHYVILPRKTHRNNREEIDGWLQENIQFSFMRRNENGIYYFWRNTDAVGFKLRWI